MQSVYNAQTQIDRIKAAMDEYASIDNVIDAHLALEFIINCYLVAVGFRPLFYSDASSLNKVFWESVIYQAKILFPQLSFDQTHVHNWFYIHHPLLILDEYISDKNLGALLNFIDPLNLENKPEDGVQLAIYCSYKHIFDFPLTGYIIRGSTQVSQVANKVFQMQLLLKNINVRVSSRINPLMD